MPAPDADCRPTIRPLESEEASRWLRLLLTGSVQHTFSRKISSHSLKTTLLSFASKFGVPAEERVIMGYHVSNTKMAHVYARDAAAPTILILEEMIACIREGSFKPDNTRSGRFSGSKAEILKAGRSRGARAHMERPEVGEISDDQGVVLIDPPKGDEASESAFAAKPEDDASSSHLRLLWRNHLYPSAVSFCQICRKGTACGSIRGQGYCTWQRLNTGCSSHVAVV